MFRKGMRSKLTRPSEFTLIKNENLNCFAYYHDGVRHNLKHSRKNLLNPMATLNSFAIALHEIQNHACDLWRQCRCRASVRRGPGGKPSFAYGSREDATAPLCSSPVSHVTLRQNHPLPARLDRMP